MTAHDRVATLSPEERDRFDYWMQRVQSNEANEALFHALSLMIRHDTAGLHMAVVGNGDLLDRALAQIDALVAVAKRQDQRLDQIARDGAQLQAAIGPAPLDDPRPLNERQRADAAAIAQLQIASARAHTLAIVALSLSLLALSLVAAHLAATLIG